jgi:hypothetical protein
MIELKDIHSIGRIINNGKYVAILKNREQQEITQDDYLRLDKEIDELLKSIY